MNENLKLKGHITIKRYHNDELVEVKEFPNLVVNAGKSEVAKLISGLSTTPFKYIAIGTGTTAETASDTALQTEVQRAEATVSSGTTNVSGDTAVFDADFTFSSATAVTEYGLFNASTGGTMLSRKVKSALNLDSGDSVHITWKIIQE